eukprot:4766656-Alexandrium_andersonii.AAC.1
MCIRDRGSVGRLPTAFCSFGQLSRLLIGPAAFCRSQFAESCVIRPAPIGWLLARQCPRICLLYTSPSPRD